MTEFYFRTPQMDITPDTLNHTSLKHALYCLGSFLRGDFSYDDFMKEIKEITDSNKVIALFEVQWDIGIDRYYFGFTCNKDGIYEEWLQYGESKQYLYKRKQCNVYSGDKEYFIDCNNLVMFSQDIFKDLVIQVLCDYYREVSYLQ